jgi:hypothetical protein
MPIPMRSGTGISIKELSDRDLRIEFLVTHQTQEKNIWQSDSLGTDVPPGSVKQSSGKVEGPPHDGTKRSKKKLVEIHLPV